MSSRWYEDYERGRPGYPAASARLPDSPGAKLVLELGAGTGKLTRLLVREHAVVYALEPDPEMRRWLAALCPEAGLIAAAAEAIPIAERSADAVFSAEAFRGDSNR
jgi:16S rRNA A1518/A1519 N6-dimethyltransferase RsmA/KsgA/DIM1 with predicted DNA glycosylase/AP lyase activity